MSFTENKTNIGYAPGYFLASAECTRETVEVSASHAQVVTLANGAKYVPAGAVIPSNDGNAKGILYEDVDVSTGNMPGSMVTKGSVYEDRLPAAIESTAEAVLPGITVITTTPKPVRPSSFKGTDLATITVASTAGTGAGKTDVAVTYTLKAGERLAYKTGATAPTATFGEVVATSGAGSWTVATFPLDELSATSGHHIAVVAIDSTGAVTAYGEDTIAVGA